MIGGKFQFIGGSRTSNSTGHKLSGGILLGQNDHETEDKSVEFTLGGREYLVLYGYRFSESIMPYASLSVAQYSFEGTVTSSNPSLNGLKPSISTNVKSLSAGLELAYESIFAKLEGTYQELKSTRTKDRTHLVFGYSLGYAW